jgi:hypothetical protein
MHFIIPASIGIELKKSHENWPSKSCVYDSLSLILPVRKPTDIKFTFVGWKIRFWSNFWGYPDFSSCIIRLVKNRASGFRSLSPFVDMIFLIAGDLDLPGQIPAKFCAL